MVSPRGVPPDLVHRPQGGNRQWADVGRAGCPHRPEPGRADDGRVLCEQLVIVPNVAGAVCRQVDEEYQQEKNRPGNDSARPPGTWLERSDDGAHDGG